MLVREEDGVKRIRRDTRFIQRLAKRFGVLKHAFVERLTTATAPEDEQNFLMERYGQSLPCACFRVRPKRGTDGRARVRAPFEFFRCFGKACKRANAFVCRQLGGQSRRQIAFVGKARNFQFFASKYDGERDESAFGKHRVRLKNFKTYLCLFYRVS